MYPAYEYDSANRMLEYERGFLAAGGAKIDVPISLPETFVFRAYNLDLLGNWVTEGGKPAILYAHPCEAPKKEDRTTNSLNQIATIDTVGLPYDNNGNLTGNGDLVYQFDAFNRLRNVLLPDMTLIANYYYDAHPGAPGGRRIRSVIADLGSGYGGIDHNVPAGTTNYLYAGSQCLEERNGDSPARQYVWGRYIDELIQQREFQNDAGDYYALTDELYRTVALCDPRGRIHSTYDTDIYGITQIYIAPDPYTGRWFTDGDVPISRFRPGMGLPALCPYIFTGRRHDRESRLHYFRGRYFDPAQGRFIGRDPIDYAGGLGLYEYCGGRAATGMDPMGLMDPEHYNGAGMSARESDEAWLEERASVPIPPPHPHWEVDAKFHTGEGLTQARHLEEEAHQRGRWYEQHGDRKNANWWYLTAGDWMYYAEGEAAQGDINYPSAANAYYRWVLRWFGSQPSTKGSFVPVAGSLRSSVNYYSEGRWAWGTIWAAAAVSDVFLIRSLVTGLLRGGWRIAGPYGWKGWTGVSKWLGDIGFRDFKGQIIHHWAAGRNSGIFKSLPDWIKNQPWNYVRMPSQQIHNIVEAKGAGRAMNPIVRSFYQVWYGTPDWFKAHWLSIDLRLYRADVNLQADAKNEPTTRP